MIFQLSRITLSHTFQPKEELMRKGQLPLLIVLGVVIIATGILGAIGCQESKQESVEKAEVKTDCDGAICEGYWGDSTRAIGECPANCEIGTVMLALRDRVSPLAKEAAQALCMSHGCNCPPGGTTRIIPSGTGCGEVQDTMDMEGNPLETPVTYCGYWVMMKHYGGKCAVPGS
jgi:hypothetical protein